MILITHVYAPNEKTKQAIDSFKRFGYEVAVIESEDFRGNADVLRKLYECYKRAVTGHDTFVYFDAGDSYCQRPLNEDFFRNKLVYSAEKNLFPLKELQSEYDKYAWSTPWCYLNGGAYGGPLKAIIDFFEKYGLHELPADVCAQHAQATAFLKEYTSGMTICLDTDCVEFQSMAFENQEQSEFEIMHPSVQGNTLDDFGVNTSLVVNLITNNCPAILHFNGQTDMSIVNKLKIVHED